MRHLRAIACVTLTFMLCWSVAAQTSNHQWRAVHLFCGHEADLVTLDKQVPQLAQLGINVIIFEVDYNFEYKSHPELRANATPITVAGARQFVAKCRKNGIRVIPEFQCLGHQSWKEHTDPLLTKYPELDLTPGAFPGNKDLYCREWNPLDPRVNKIIFPLMDELIDAFQADALDVGMDEIFLLGTKQSPATEGKDPAQILAKAINEYYAHLTRQCHVQMLMWADRLIDGKQLQLGEWEASHNGTAPAADLIPKDIILCPWHYSKQDAYPSIPYLTSKGFRVLPASWEDVAATEALIEYCRALHDNPKIIGHIFTTWSTKAADLAAFPPLVTGLRLLQQSPAK